MFDGCVVRKRDDSECPAYKLASLLLVQLVRVRKEKMAFRGLYSFKPGQ